MTLKRVRAKAIDLLARRDHSEKELESKLRSRGGEAADVALVLQDLRGIGLLDDRRFALAFLSYRESKAWGARRYRQELLLRGVSAEIIDDVMRDMLESPEGAPLGKLQELVRRDLERGKDAQKVVAAMVRRGFSYGDVKDVLRRLDTGDILGLDD